MDWAAVGGFFFRGGRCFSIGEGAAEIFLGKSFCLVVLRQEGRKDSEKVRLLLEGCGGFAVFGQRRNLLAERVIS